MKPLGYAGASAPPDGATDSSLPKVGLPELDENPKLFKLMEAALIQACNEVAVIGKQYAFAVIETPSGQFIQGFKNERFELGYDEARQALLAAPPEAERYALTWAGYVAVDGVRYETVMVAGGERGKANGVTMGQRYKVLPGIKFQPVGNPQILGPDDNLLTLASDPRAASKLKPVLEKITADVDHNRSPGGSNGPPYQFRKCKELVLAFGDLDMPFRKELQKKPDMVHVVMNRRIWATIFKPEDKEVYLNRNSLFPLQGQGPFPGFEDDGMIMLGYMPLLPSEGKAPQPSLFVLWAAEFRIADKA